MTTYTEIDIIVTTVSNGDTEEVPEQFERFSGLSLTEDEVFLDVLRSNFIDITSGFPTSACDTEYHLVDDVVVIYVPEADAEWLKDRVRLAIA